MKRYLFLNWNPPLRILEGPDGGPGSRRKNEGFSATQMATSNIR